MTYRPDSRLGDDMRADDMATRAEDQRVWNSQRLADARARAVYDKYQQYLDRCFDTLSAEVVSFDRWKARNGY